MNPTCKCYTRKCKHLRGLAEKQPQTFPRHSYWACDAFPDRIPAPICRGEHDHTEAYEGDHGVRYELTEEPNA